MCKRGGGISYLFVITIPQTAVILLQSDSCVDKKAEVLLPILPLNFHNWKKCRASVPSVVLLFPCLTPSFPVCGFYILLLLRRSF